MDIKVINLNLPSIILANSHVQPIASKTSLLSIPSKIDSFLDPFFSSFILISVSFCVIVVLTSVDIDESIESFGLRSTMSQDSVS
ncbi:hypothetical protein BpHYR1_048956 [Brachionus plicatilis]|uniref:Transmembrane protein n=1 Tax=Brachionus plicatilis TaxID=10195 RepID=A0A3M7RCV8_BRAPC|nr:hypothetical protein BpHYR1_048956 [Brachionus plicatilis]